MKVIVTIVAMIAFIMLFAESDILIVQIIVPAVGMILLYLCGKYIEKHCLTDEEKSMKV
jgi:hypothetical protein